MKILIQLTRATLELTPVSKILNDTGVRTCKMWQEELEPAFKVFDEFKPDLFIGDCNRLSRATAKCLKNVKTYLYCDEFSNELKDVKPELLIIPYKIKPGIFESVTKVVEILPVLDIDNLKNPVEDNKFKSDIITMSDYNEDTADNIHKYLFPLLNNDYKLKIFGGTSWPFPHHVGTINYNNLKNILFNTKIYLHIVGSADRPHHMPYAAIYMNKPVLTNSLHMLNLFPDACIDLNSYTGSMEDIIIEPKYDEDKIWTTYKMASFIGEVSVI